VLLQRLQCEDLDQVIQSGVRELQYGKRRGRTGRESRDWVRGDAPELSGSDPLAELVDKLEVV
jgi:hypothetical protein